MKETVPTPDPVDFATVRWFQNLDDRGVLITDRDLIVRSWNRWLVSNTGHGETDVVGRHLFEIYPGLPERGIDRYYAEALSGEVRVLSERLHKCLLPIVRTYHATGPIEMSQAGRIEPLTHEGRVIGTITVIEDVTERVMTERELRAQIASSEEARRVAEEASRLKDEFLATLSHEIRTPLNAVLGWARILRGEVTSSVRLHAIDVIERNSIAQLRIIEDLLDTARVIAGKLQLQVQDVDVAAVTRAALDVTAPSAKAKRITVETHLPAEAPWVLGDPDRLQQVVWNILGNAVKFTSAGGTIHVDLEQRGDQVRLAIRDTGAGISAEFLPHVFERFRQADGSPSRRHGGLGLGLALVRHIVELHGGVVTAESAGVGHGTTFEIALPAAACRKSGRATSLASSPVNLAGVRVLLVEDDSDARELLTTALERYGANVRSASSAGDALAMLRTGEMPAHILVSDVGMPDMDGYAFMRTLRSLPVATAAVPAIAFTAYASPDDRDRAVRAGYQRHLAKPLDPLQLAMTIAEVLHEDN